MNMADVISRREHLHKRKGKEDLKGNCFPQLQTATASQRQCTHYMRYHEQSNDIFISACSVPDQVLLTIIMRFN